ncbi:TIR domain-containing protein [Indioceanicola profundi]|uniref:TIR domain-containing protein n=1 Tax=Indioceanicola profundi TaxID=2220096 RepID=UPI000E6AB858|nr:TIR domain-containing protein [Indioceanicola profundi]
MARRTFFSFHYQRDVWRVNQIRNGHQFIGTAAAGFQDASLWEEAKKKGDRVIKRMIDDALEYTTVTVVCIGYKTAGRTYINYEIERSLARGNGIIGLMVNGLLGPDRKSDPDGTVPGLLTKHKAPIYRYRDVASLGDWIEKAYQNR